MLRLLFVLLFTTLTAFSAFVAIRVPFVSIGVPHSLPGAEALYQFHGLVFGSNVITAQFLLVWLSGALLGPRRGALAMLWYIVLGLTGLPIFTNGGGPAYVLQPTFGYLAAFVPAAIVVGRMTQDPRFGRTWRGMFIGYALIQGLGLLYELIVRGRIFSPGAWWELGWSQVGQFMLGDLALLTSVAFVVAVARKADALYLDHQRAKRDAERGPVLPPAAGESAPA